MYKYYDSFMEIFRLYKLEEISEALDLTGKETILDIGGGTGRLAQYLSNQCKKIYILDESEGMLSAVKEHEKVIPIVGDGLSTGFEKGSIDVVILSDVLHHIQNQSELIEEIHRVLKGDGRLLILEFDKRYLKTKLLRIFEYFLFGKLYFKSVEEIFTLLKGKFTVFKCLSKGFYFIIVGDKYAG